MSLKLCIVTPSHWKAVMGGSQYQAQILVEYLVGHYDVDIAYLTTRALPDYRPVGYRVVRFSRPTGLRRFALFFDCIRLYAALRREKPDVILQIIGSAHTGIAAFYARRAGCRMVWRVSSDRSVVRAPLRPWRLHKRLDELFLDYGIRNADLILAQSRYQQAQLSIRFGRDDARVVPNFHPVPAVLGAPIVKRGPPWIVVWIAALKPLKNPGAFLRLAQCFADRADVRFLMIGRALPEEGAWTRTLLQDLERQPNLDYVGEISQDEVNAVIEQAHVLVNTSDYEGFSNTFVQAWMRRMPVVSLTVDPDGLLSRKRLGFVSGTEQQLARDVRRLIDRPKHRAVIGARCRDYALTHHTVANIDELASMLYVPLAGQGIAFAGMTVQNS